jgi:hypothetical protein
MLSKPVARVTSFVATSIAALPQDIQTDDISPQQSMQVRKHNGAAEPGDVTGIVRARPMGYVERHESRQGPPRPYWGG